MRLQALAGLGAAVVGLTGTSVGFSFSSQSSKQKQVQNAVRSTHMPMQMNDSDEDQVTTNSRRDFLAKVVAAAAPALLPASQASAVTNEPTTIELSVDTEYLIRVLNYFDGDMRKVLATLVRSPQTSVEISPPAKTFRGEDPKDAILRALYSYESPNDYVEHASWLKVDEPSSKGLIGKSLDFLTKKRYEVPLPIVGTEGEKGTGEMVVVLQPKPINLSNLEAGVALAAVSYPLAYSYYNYESYKEEQEKIAKKAQMAAKRAAKAKAAAAKKSKGTPKKASVEGKADEGKKKPPTIKGQEKKTKKVITVEKDSAAKVKPEKKEDSAEEKVAAEMLDSKREKFIESKEKQQSEEKVATEMLDSKRENFIASTEQESIEVDNELEQLVAAASAAAESKNTPAGGGAGAGYLDNISQAAADSRPSGSNLRTLAENVQTKRGPFNNYLDSL